MELEEILKNHKNHLFILVDDEMFCGDMKINIEDVFKFFGIEYKYY